MQVKKIVNRALNRAKVIIAEWAEKFIERDIILAAPQIWLLCKVLYSKWYNRLDRLHPEFLGNPRFNFHNRYYLIQRTEIEWDWDQSEYVEVDTPYFQIKRVRG